MRARTVVALLGLAWLSACASASPVASPTGSGEQEALAACPSINLRTPAGDPIQLSGRWRSDDGGTYYLRQVRSCVWWMGLSGGTGAPGGVGTTNWTNSFFGTITPDSTLRGTWADVPWGVEEGVGELAWKITYDEVDGEEGVTLEQIESTSAFGGQFLARPDTDVDLRVRLQESEECLSVVTDAGEVYQVAVLPPGWSVGVPTQLYGPDGEGILPSDLFGMIGELAHGTGFCGPGLIIFADQIEATAPS